MHATRGRAARRTRGRRQSACLNDSLAPMKPDQFRVDPDVRLARTPPAEMYSDAGWAAAIAGRVLARGWHVAADASEIAVNETAFPFTLLPGVLDEPLVLTRDRTGA